jgi:hypothetical protein
MNTNSHLERGSRGGQRKLLHGSLHIEASADRLHRVLFARLFCTEYGHDGVSDVLFRQAAVRGNDGVECRPYRAHEVANVLNVSFVRKRGETGEISKKHGDLLALGLGGSFPRDRGGRAFDRSAARWAEFCAYR